MPTKKDIDAILRDCIAADPALREREEELRPLIATLLESKPDTRFSKDFAADLKAMLAEARQSRAIKLRPTPSLLDFMRFKTSTYVLSGGAVFGLLLAVILAQQASVPHATPLATNDDVPVTHGVQIAAVSSNAFGSLSSVSAVGATPAPMADGAEMGNAASAPSHVGDTMTITSPSATSAAAPATRPQSGGGGASVDAKMMAMPYVPMNYRYVYKGELLQPDATIDVYRHVRGLPSAGMLSSFGKLTAGLINGSKFASGALQSLNVVEDREFGYMIGVDAVEGTISLSQNWQRWPHPENLCRDEACYKQYQMKAEDFPSDDKIVAVAEAFFSEYGVDRASFGKPEVRNEWRSVSVDGPQTEMRVYVPDTVTVVFPLLLDGKPVQDENGMSNGININVNVRQMKVDGLYNLSSNRYERSSYAAETDTARIAKFVEQGGLYAGWNDPAAKIVDIELGTPEIVLTSYWKDNGDGTGGQNLFVPALRFAVLNPPADQPWFRKAVTVPLSKDLLDQAEQQNNQPMPVPMPLDAASSGSAVR